MLKIAIAQINATVGDLGGNQRKILDYIARAKRMRVDLVVFPELALCGYPPEDLLLKKHFIADTQHALNVMVKKIHGISAIVGFVDTDAQGKIYNAAVLITDGLVRGVYHKQELPNYGVFDEKRYFSKGTDAGIFKVGDIYVGVNICEDIWVDDAVWHKQVKADAKVLINISSSPYHAGKLALRKALLTRRAQSVKVPIVYVNGVGGQDELVFDGASMLVSSQGNVVARARQFQEELLIVDTHASEGVLAEVLETEAEIYEALVLGTKDYALKNGFTKVVLGLSGGIDSALVACIAVDALGCANVTAVSMPSVFNSKATRQDARQLAKNLNIAFKEIPIQRIFNAYLKTMAPYFKDTHPDVTEENIQARIRGNILMAMANKFGGLVLTTGNKSEMAVGYCTLYGDMSGGFAVIKDVFKTTVFALARLRNRKAVHPVIPKNVLLRAPSAELRADQTDEAALGSYADLDQILMAYIEHHASIEAMIASGLPAQRVVDTVKRVDANEYKRRQAALGVKITACAFGKDWRLPITNRYKE